MWTIWWINCRQSSHNNLLASNYLVTMHIQFMDCIEQKVHTPSDHPIYSSVEKSYIKITEALTSWSSQGQCIMGKWIVDKWQKITCHLIQDIGEYSENVSQVNITYILIILETIPMHYSVGEKYSLRYYLSNLPANQTTHHSSSANES